LTRSSRIRAQLRHAAGGSIRRQWAWLLVVALLHAPLAWSQQGISPEERERALEMLRELSPAERERAREALNQGRMPDVLGVDSAQEGDTRRPQAVETESRDGAAPDADDGEADDDGERSRIERQMNRATGAAGLAIEPVTRAVDEPLEQFGYSLFRGEPSTFAPVTEIPVPVGYVIGPGDTLHVQLYGKENAEYSLTVNREGMISFPRIGPVSVAGLDFEQVRQELRQRVSEQLIGVNVSISLGRLRSMRVFVLGDVRHPGAYTVSSLSTMTNALFVSGGVHPMGSLRRVQLKRNGERVGTLDLYDLLLEGDTSSDQRLRPGDVIFVPPIGPTVGIAGEVRRPAIYELKGETSVSQALELAGGLMATADRESAQLDVISAQNNGRRIHDLRLDAPEISRRTLADGDLLRVYSVGDAMDNVVLLRGHARHPGGYEWHQGMRITDLIPSPQALLPRSDLAYVVIRRELEPNGRIEVRSVDLRQAFDEPGGPEDLPLRPRDTVMVFGGADDRRGRAQGASAGAGSGSLRRASLEPLLAELRAQARKGRPQQIVRVNGEVAHAGEYPLEPGMTVADLIRAAGGLQQDAYPLQAELTRFDDQTEQRQVRTVDVRLAGAGASEAAQVELAPFDTLNVKPVPQWDEAQTVQLVGEVRFPGTYTIRRGETLREVLRRAGGITDMGYAEGAVFSRQMLRQREREELADLEERLRRDMAQASLSQAQAAAAQGERDGTGEALSFARSLLSDLQTAEPTGRLVIDLPAILDGRSNVELRGGDRLVVPTEPDSVTVIGQVARTTSHQYQDAFSHEDYIERSGGFRARADRDGIYVVRADGAVVTDIGGGGWFPLRGEAMIRRGDVIVVPLDVTRVPPLQLWRTVAQVLQSFSLTAASANAVGVF